MTGRCSPSSPMGRPATRSTAFRASCCCLPTSPRTISSSSRPSAPMARRPPPVSTGTAAPQPPLWRTSSAADKHPKGVDETTSRTYGCALFHGGTGVVGAILRGQVAASKAFDRLLPAPMRVDGSRFFREVFLASFLEPDQRIVDLGSGRFPCIDEPTKKRLSLHVTGIDASAAELAAAPAGSYDETIVADVTAYRGSG